PGCGTDRDRRLVLVASPSRSPCHVFVVAGSRRPASPAGDPCPQARQLPLPSAYHGPLLRTAPGAFLAALPDASLCGLSAVAADQLRRGPQPPFAPARQARTRLLERGRP